MSGSTQAAARLGLRTGKQCREDLDSRFGFRMPSCAALPGGCPEDSSVREGFRALSVVHCRLRERRGRPVHLADHDSATGGWLAATPRGATSA